MLRHLLCENNQTYVHLRQEVISCAITLTHAHTSLGKCTSHHRFSYSETGNTLISPLILYLWWNAFKHGISGDKPRAQRACWWKSRICIKEQLLSKRNLMASGIGLDLVKKAKLLCPEVPVAFDRRYVYHRAYHRYRNKPCTQLLDRWRWTPPYHY